MVLIEWPAASTFTDFLVDRGSETNRTSCSGNLNQEVRSIRNLDRHRPSNNLRICVLGVQAFARAGSLKTGLPPSKCTVFRSLLSGRTDTPSRGSGGTVCQSSRAECASLLGSIVERFATSRQLRRGTVRYVGHDRRFERSDEKRFFAVAVRWDFLGDGAGEVIRSVAAID